MLSYSKFKYGDQVRVNSKVGRVISVSKGVSLSGYTYRVEFIDKTSKMFDEKDLAENKVKYPSNWWGSGDNKLKYDFSTHCPKCNNSWHSVEHPIFGKKEIWYDCKKCNKTKESILKEFEGE